MWIMKWFWLWEVEERRLENETPINYTEIKDDYICEAHLGQKTTVSENIYREG